ncbi:DUF4013 domain-containing protein [Halalkalicoccus jeotgali]|uniref:DUF4013 domain-containing protein n=1 Tax=Halalkalicoccus jeotgali (strain DSM 18796 / CECT 7217 / JCM 14584 / KCTC 4019 / B3) TaxID=795797 RepID=D8J398_HALJB|nr:DUF4013 domain-containing protein [Halalkalicoccus jeotgali]ADJ15205.1 hypothetical protein HacjB3_09110 [Halalkalicoccus jeotgali B3]ELY35218.1 hypothetical protein C497_13568 [Halalkalicoccus jeotgali B3]
MSERLGFLRGPNAEEALLVGWICLSVHALFVPVVALVPAAGYLVVVARAVIDGESALPRVAFGPLVGEGLVAGAIALAYGAVPLAVGTVTVSLATGSARALEGGASPFFLVGSTLTLFFVLAGLYVVPIALCGYARDGREAVTAPSFRVAGRAAYFVGWTSALVVLTAGALAGSVAGAVPLVGPLLASLCWWITALAATRRLAAGYREA